jgi:hypothetical protein
MTEFSPSKTPITAGGSVLYPRLSDAEIESIMQHVAEHDKTGTEIGRDRMLHIATYWRNAADNYESAVLKAIAIQGRYHVMELLREVNRLRRIVDALPKTADGVPIYPGMHVWFYSARSASQSIDELKVLGWDWLPNLAPDAMHCLNVVNEHGDEDVVNLACCYSTFDAADQARFAVKEIASRKASEADADLDEAARAMFTDNQLAAWEAMGRKTCRTCGVPLRPCPKGPGADEPGYVSFYPCMHDDEDPNG